MQSFAMSFMNTLASISLPSLVQTLAVIAGAVLVGAGLSTMSSVYLASRSHSLETAREQIKEKVNQNRNPNARLLFHYTDSEINADSIMATGEIWEGPASGPFPRGAYATDIAGWLPVELMRRSQLVERIFGRNTPTSYAKTAWFVVFEEILPKYRFNRIAPSIYWYPGDAKIKPIAKSSNLLGE